MNINVTFREEQNNLDMSVKETDIFGVGFGSGGGTTDYNKLRNKPTINGVILEGDKSSEDLGLLTEKDLDTKAPAIYSTASGGIASFSDGADGMLVKSLIANIEPVQDLHGYDYPWPGGGGKNLLEVTGTTQTINGVTFTVNSDGTINVSGTASSAATFTIHGYQLLSDYGIESGTTYILSGTPSGLNGNAYIMLAVNGSGSEWRDTTGNGASFTPSDVTKQYRVIIIVAIGTTINAVFKPMICLASASNPTTFSPYSNICPISGHTGASVTRTGVNLFDKSTVVTGYVDNDDGVVRGPTSNHKCTDFIPVKEGLSYYVKSDQTTSKWGAWYDSDKNYITGVIGYANAVITAPSGAKYVRLTIRGNVDDGGNVDTFGVNYPSTDHDYHPYSGQTVSITFPSSAGTVYGGTLDVTNGVLTVDSLLWRTTWGAGTNSGTATDIRRRAFYPSVNADLISRDEGKCNVAPTLRQLDVIGAYFIYATQFYVTLPVDTPDSTEIELYYKTEQKQTYQLTPQQINTLLGSNNIYSDVGSIADVQYPADTKLYIDGKIAEAIAAALNA